MIMIRTGGSQRIEHVQVSIVAGRRKFSTFFISFFYLLARVCLSEDECSFMIAGGPRDVLEWSESHKFALYFGSFFFGRR